MDKKFYLWLQKIADINEKFNFNMYLENKEQIIKIYNDLTFKENKYEKIESSIITLLLDKNIKKDVENRYNELKIKNLQIVTIEECNYPKKLFNSQEDIPFCYFSNSNINLNNLNIYIYYNDYFTKFAKNIIEYFGKIINSEKANVITEYDSDKFLTLKIGTNEILKNNNCNCVILSHEKYIKCFKWAIISAMIIIEARYESKIIKIVDRFLDSGKDIYVVPSSIFRKNTYFSNYLIKQGADIILNKWDLKFILKSIIC